MNLVGANVPDNLSNISSDNNNNSNNPLESIPVGIKVLIRVVTVPVIIVLLVNYIYICFLKLYNNDLFLFTLTFFI